MLLTSICFFFSVKEMKKKWQKIQNKFHRYVHQVGPASKKKTYVYAEYLQFLLVNTSELRPARRSCKKSRRTEGPLDEDTRSVDESSEEVEEPTPGPGVAQSLKPGCSTRIINNKSHSTECQTKQTNDSTSSPEQEQDADKMFLLSLLPDFKSMHEEDKLDVRIFTMQFMRYAKRKRRMKTGDTT